MWERRAVVMLGVLLAHVFVFHSLVRLTRTTDRHPAGEVLRTEPIMLLLEDLVEPEPAGLPPAAMPAPPQTRSTTPAVAALPAPAEPGPITPPVRVDWPIEAKKSATRVLAAEAEALRIAKMFAGPGGTWASLTKRQRSKVSKFRWKPGVDGLERDSAGNTIYRLSDGCVLVNFSFIGCAIGKPKIHDDMFENMRLYFDEQRLPSTDEGNGTEPGAQPLR
jgi:hypothetical protein